MVAPVGSCHEAGRLDPLCFTRMCLAVTSVGPCNSGQSNMRQYDFGISCQRPDKTKGRAAVMQYATLSWDSATYNNMIFGTSRGNGQIERRSLLYNTHLEERNMLCLPRTVQYETMCFSGSHSNWSERKGRRRTIQYT